MNFELEFVGQSAAIPIFSNFMWETNHYSILIPEPPRHSRVPKVRRLPYAPLSGVQRKQEVAKQQEHLHRDLRRSQMQPLRRLSPRQVRPVLSQMNNGTTRFE